MSVVASTGFDMIEWRKGNFKCRRPDFDVVRVHLGTITSDDQLKLLHDALDTIDDPSVKKHLNASKFYSKKRNRCKTNEKKEYVNVAGGKHGDPALDKVARILTSCNFSVVITPGPFIRATQGNLVTLMPLATGSTYKGMVDLLPEAEKLAKPDPDFDLEGATASSYGNHSFRQLADRCARDYRHLSGATEVEIDRMFGWNEAMYRRVMQLHYAGRHERVKRKMITGYM